MAKNNNSANNGEVMEMEAPQETGVSVLYNEDASLEVVAVTQTAEAAMATIDALANLSTLKKGFELTAEYLKLQEGETVRGIYAGLHKMQSTQGDNATNARVDEDGNIEAVKILIESSMPGKPKFVIMADIVVVGTLKQMPINIPVEIACVGMEKGKNGKYRKFSIQQLY